MKRCPKCRKTKTYAEFSARLDGALRACCIRCTEYGERYRQEHREWFRVYRREEYAKRRQAVFDHYGHACLCCGETRQEFLVIDHVLGGGEQHRREIGSRLYAWLIDNNYPAEFRVLCDNCNASRGRYGYCPHENERKAA